jgi:hypothetical protein
MLGQFEPKFRAQLDSETERLLRELNSSPEDLRWAEGYVADIYLLETIPLDDCHRDQA